MAESIVSIRNRYENLKASIKRPAIRSMAAATGVVGAATSGAIRAMGYENLPGTEVPTDIALGAAATAAGVMGMAGKSSSQLMAFGIGLMAPGISRITETAVREWRAKAA